MKYWIKILIFCVMIGYSFFSEHSFIFNFFLFSLMMIFMVHLIKDTVLKSNNFLLKHLQNTTNEEEMLKNDLLLTMCKFEQNK